jgi:hypothetical protein
VGRYRLESEIGRGGMGRIIRIHDDDFDRALAMKVLLQQGGEHEARFAREARLTGLLQHPGIPPVHALGKLADGRPYFVMKLVQGRSLKELLKDRSSSAVELPRFVDIFEHICQAVGYAHSQGVIHRDLKPGNVMVGAFGEVQVMDWGLAKVLAPQGEEDSGRSSGQDTLLALRRTTDLFEATLAGMVMGTPAYMAPEQARGKPVDARADVFSLGAILCEILTTRPAYQGRDGAEIWRRGCEGDLAGTFAVLAGCGADGELVALARNCLAPDPKDRLPDGSAVAAVVAAYRIDLEKRRRQAEIDLAAAEARAEEEKRARAAEKALGQEEHKRHEAEVGKRRAERRRRWMALALGLILVLLVYVFGVRYIASIQSELLENSSQTAPPLKQAAPTISDAPVDWREFTSGEGFSVWMPGKPEMLPFEGWTIHKFAWTDKRMLFLAGSSRTLTEEETVEPRLWNDVRRGLSALATGTVKQVTSITVGSNQGKEYVIESFHDKDNYQTQGVFRYYLVGNHLVMINVGYPGNSAPSEARLFLDSFKLTN